VTVCVVSNISVTVWVVILRVQWLDYSARRVGMRLEGPKLEHEGLRAELEFPTADPSIQGTLFSFCGI